MQWLVAGLDVIYLLANTGKCQVTLLNESSKRLLKNVWVRRGGVGLTHVFGPEGLLWRIGQHFFGGKPKVSVVWLKAAMPFRARQGTRRARRSQARADGPGHSHLTMIM